MSLVDKLDGVHVGDLVVLEGASRASSIVGYVKDYGPNSVTLCNMNTVKRTGETAMAWFGRAGEEITIVYLKNFDTYRILEKYVAPDNQTKE